MTFNPSFTSGGTCGAVEGVAEFCAAPSTAGTGTEPDGGMVGIGCKGGTWGKNGVSVVLLAGIFSTGDAWRMSAGAASVLICCNGACGTGGAIGTLTSTGVSASGTTSGRGRGGSSVIA